MMVHPLRTKTSDFTGFFRGAGHSSGQTQKEPSVNLEVPSSSTGASPKKKATRIQLFGRSTKKSNQSTSSSPFISSRDSADFGELLLVRAASSDQRPSVSAPSLPLKPHPIGYKLAHSLLPKLSQPEPACPSTFSASTSRPASSESGSSSGSWSRSSTPQPSQPPEPLVTISLSTDLSEYKNLFTRPLALDFDSDLTPSPTPKSDSPIYRRRGQTSASAIAAAHRQVTSDRDDRSPCASRYSRKNSDSDKGHEETLGPSGAQESPRATPDGKRGLHPSPQRHPSPVTRSVQSSEISNSPLMRSRMNQPSNPIQSRPPSMPLPQTVTPVPSAPPPEILLSLPRQTSTDTTNAQKPPSARPRAHMIGLVGNLPLPASADQSTPNTMVTLSPPSTDILEADFDIDTASAPQLRAALRTRNQQHEELNTYMLKVTEAHVMEVTNLEKKVFTLEKEVARKEKELKGMKWIINNEDSDSSQAQPLSTGVNHLLLSPTSTLLESGDNSRIIPGTSRLYYQNDSGTESHADSESIRSAAFWSQARSFFGHKSLRTKPSTLAEITHNFCHTGSTRRPPPGLLGAEKISAMPNKRSSSSLSSVSPSPSSFTSSLLPPSPSITTSSLSAIPEGPPSALRPSLRYESDNSDPEERRALRASHRTSTSSMTSSSTAASSAYSGNIKRSRPPPIAQVLEESPIMDNVLLEKLRPFA